MLLNRVADKNRRELADLKWALGSTFRHIMQ